MIKKVKWLPLFLLLAACQPKPPEREALQVLSGGATHAFQVEIADDEQERETGLMNRDNLPAGQGMLFLFPDARERAFWMKNTHIPLDILYISKSGEVISIQKNTMPMNETPLHSFGPAAAVLEINGGQADALGIKPGDRITHRFFEGKGPMPQ
ncbi:DUF192 domain-containing protein [Asticcacaulis excentricus]|uniref:Exported protein n=1 Tax=Asticcacaulis excentricus TaxID=78587 RepID=A0A3G9G601_9CAUL|nr:DUF192 domain-containing protein [Asticcacaulis excentricus]BBF82106.1 exported protein [Asticcacaulis excentricus]